MYPELYTRCFGDFTCWISPLPALSSPAVIGRIDSSRGSNPSSCSSTSSGGACSCVPAPALVRVGSSDNAGNASRPALSRSNTSLDPFDLLPLPLPLPLLRARLLPRSSPLLCLLAKAASRLCHPSSAKAPFRMSVSVGALLVAPAAAAQAPSGWSALSAFTVACPMLPAALRPVCVMLLRCWCACGSWRDARCWSARAVVRVPEALRPIRFAQLLLLAGTIYAIDRAIVQEIVVVAVTVVPPQ